MVQSKFSGLRIPYRTGHMGFALHENSRSRKFYTYYLATSKDRVGGWSHQCAQRFYKSTKKLIQSLLYSIRLKDLNTISKTSNWLRHKNTQGSSFNDDEVKLQQTQTMGESGLGGLSHWPKEKLAILVLSGLAIVFAMFGPF